MQVCTCTVQVLVSRNTAPVDTAVVSVTRFMGAQGAFNVIPDAVTIGGTMRALTMETAVLLKTRLVEVGSYTPAPSSPLQSAPCVTLASYSPCRLPGTLCSPLSAAMTSCTALGVRHQ